MTEKLLQKIDIKTIGWVLFICFITGLIPAVIVSRETSGYVASIIFSILVMFCGLPLVSILFLLSILMAFQNKGKATALLILSCILIPTFFLTSLKFMETTGFAIYKRAGVDEMRPFEFDATKGWTIVYKKGIDFEQRQKFSNETFFPFESNKGFTYESGVCEASGQNINDYVADTIYFCSNSTEEQQSKLREKLKQSSIVLKFYENKKVGKINNLP